MHNACFAFPRFGIAGWSGCSCPQLRSFSSPSELFPLVIAEVKLVESQLEWSVRFCARKFGSQQQCWGGAGGGDEAALALTRHRCSTIDEPSSKIYRCLTIGGPRQQNLSSASPSVKFVNVSRASSNSNECHADDSCGSPLNPAVHAPDLLTKLVNYRTSKC